MKEKSKEEKEAKLKEIERLKRVIEAVEGSSHGNYTRFGAKIGVSGTRVSNWLDENRQNSPSAIEILNISKVYNVRQEYLLLGEEPMFKDDNLVLFHKQNVKIEKTQSEHRKENFMDFFVAFDERLNKCLSIIDKQARVINEQKEEIKTLEHKVITENKHEGQQGRAHTKVKPHVKHAPG